MREPQRYVPAAILLAGCALLTYARSQEAVALARPLSTVLASVPGYAVSDQVIDDEEQRVAGMTSYVARAYLRDSTVAFTTLVSYYARQTQGKTIHSPRNCLPGAGWEVMRSGTTTVAVDGATHVVNRYALRNGRETALVYYWYQGRGRLTADEYAVKWNLLRDAALLGHTEEALVRIVVPMRPSASGSAAEEDRAMSGADATAREVALRLIRDLDAALPAARARS